MADKEKKGSGGGGKGKGAEGKPKTLSKKWEKYELSEQGVKRKSKSCPKCGDGVFLAKHKDRQSCGKCGYTEFVGKKEDAGSPEYRGEKPEKEDAGKSP